MKNIGHVLEKLEYMRKEENKLQTFFIGDLHEENILVNKETKKIQICDIDSCKIGNNQPFRTKYSFLKAYYYVFKHLNKKYPFNSNNIFIPNEDFDLYCYIVIILNTLFHINVLCLDVTDYFKQIYSLKEQGLPRPLFQIFLNIYSPAKNENPYRYLDAIPESFERKRKL